MLKTTGIVQTRNFWLKDRLEALLENLMRTFELPNWPDCTVQIDLITQEITWTIRQLNKWNKQNER
jgi:hypothetical protein